MPHIDLKVRKDIVQMWCTIQGISYRCIAKRMNVSPNAVKNIIIKFGEHATLDDLPNRGRKKGPTNKKLDLKICRLNKENRSMSVRDLAKIAKTSKSTVQRTKDRNNMKT